MILSIPSSSTATSFASALSPRVSAFRISCSVNSAFRGVWRRSCFLCASKHRGMADLLNEKKSSSTSSGAAAAAVASSSTSDFDQRDVAPPRTFLDARSEQDLLLGIRKEVEAGRLPRNVAEGMEELYHNYRNAVFLSEHPEANETVLSNMASTLDRIFMDVRDPFEFAAHHEAIREPFDYYMFGQNYIRPLIDFRNSYVGNISVFSEIEKKIRQGENVILISNHQTEADPAVIALLLESTHPHLAEDLIYVAGDRVVTDPMSKPFSMGRNLLCVYSKKHMNDDPELIDMKKKANTKSLKEMAFLLRIIWEMPLFSGLRKILPVPQHCLLPRAVNLSWACRVLPHQPRERSGEGRGEEKNRSRNSQHKKALIIISFGTIYSRVFLEHVNLKSRQHSLSIRETFFISCCSMFPTEPRMKFAWLHE